MFRRVWVRLFFYRLFFTPLSSVKSYSAFCLSVQTVVGQVVKPQMMLTEGEAQNLLFCSFCFFVVLFGGRGQGVGGGGGGG